MMEEERFAVDQLDEEAGVAAGAAVAEDEPGAAEEADDEVPLEAAGAP